MPFGFGFAVYVKNITGAPPPVYIPNMNFSKARNSMYIPVMYSI